MSFDFILEFKSIGHLRTKLPNKLKKVETIEVVHDQTIAFGPMNSNLSENVMDKISEEVHIKVDEIEKKASTNVKRRKI